MKKIAQKRAILVSLLLILVMIIVPLISGCQSTDKSESYLNTSSIEEASFDFDSVENKTRVVWASTLTNDTIYNIKGFSVRFKLLNGSTQVKTETFNYDLTVKHGKSSTRRFSFYAEGEITSIEYVAWNARYASFWNTYQIWFIVTIVLAAVALLAYVIIIIVANLDLSDTVGEIVDFFGEHGWVAVCFLIPLAGTIWGIVTSNWVSVLIVLGGVVAFALLALLAHLIKFTVERIAKNGGIIDEEEDDDEEYFDTASESVADYIDDEEKLTLFSVEQLKEYCRKEGIKGYSALNKSNLVALIANSNNERNSQHKNKPVQKSNSRITFDDIAGLEEAKTAFKEKVVYAFEHRELYEKYGKKVGGGLLLYGLPGTGKTMFAEAASNETNALFIPVKCSDIKSKWYGESEGNVKKIFEKARKAKKAIIFFDEFEAIGAKRTDNGDNANNDLVPQILAEMQGVGSDKADCVIMVIAATNKPWAIDSAFLRPGRFDEKIYIPLPDFVARKKLFELKLKDIPQNNLDYDYLANISEGFNGADIGAFCDKLKMLAINHSIESKAESLITMDDVQQVQRVIKSSVAQEDIERLTEFNQSFN